jgi:ankyrin repeat protein
MLDSMETKNRICRIFGSALHIVASDDNLPVFKLIFEKIKNKSPKDTSSGSENTPLNIAAKNGCSGNIPKRYGETPLNLAEENDHKDIGKLLTSAISKQNDIPRNPRKKKRRT